MVLDPDAPRHFEEIFINVNFDSNDHSEEAEAGGGSPFSGCACKAPEDAVSEAAREVVDMDELGSWVSLLCKPCSIQ